MSIHRRRQSFLAFLSAAVAASILYASIHNDRSTHSASLRTNNLQDEQRRQLFKKAKLSQFTDPKSVIVRSDAPIEADEQHFNPINHESRNNCQIVYIVGVEGATHHGFVPIIENLASQQVDPSTGLPYHVESDPRALKAGLFGWFRKVTVRRWGFETTPGVGDPALVRRVVSESCPDDGRRHVLIEWASFPSGQEDDHRTYRVHRQHGWLAMGPEEIAGTDEALSHPTSMNAFYQGYSPFVDIKFVVLHRPFLETIASHRDWDRGPEIHSNIIRGFMLVLRRFLDMHVFDLVTGSRLWSLVCVEKIMAKNYDDEEDVAAARGRVLDHLADFLGWPNGECPHCFDDWHESTKNPVKVLGKENMKVMREHMKWLEGVWPPPGEVGVAEQQCGI